MSNIARVIDFMVPSSLSILTQHSGRGGRSGEPTIAVLLVEASVYQVQKVKAGQSKEGDRGNDDNNDGEDDEDDGEGIGEGNSSNNEKEGQSFRKKIDEHVQEYVEASECQCRRDIVNEYFQNPLRTARKFNLVVYRHV
jgi:superfamily II DNA helicase RecQ